MNWSNKYRLIVLIIGFILILILSFLFAFRKTYDLYHENQRLLNLTEVDDMTMMRELARARQQKHFVDSLIQAREERSSTTGLISALVQLAKQNNLQVAEVANTSAEGTDQYFTFRFSGPFISLVKFIRSVENEMQNVIIESVAFNKNTDRRTNDTRLFLNLTIRKPVYEN